MDLSERIVKQLIAIIRASFEVSDGEALCISPELIPQIEAIASRQSILSIVVVGLKNLGCSNLITDKMQIHFAKSTYDYIQRDEALKAISGAFDDSGIDYIPLKGAALRCLYPQPSMRESSDVDVLVREESLENAVSSLEKFTRFKYYKRAYHDVHFLNERVHLELHFSLLTNNDGFDRVLSRAWEYASSCGQGYKFAFSPEYQIFHVVIHAAKHLLEWGGVGIRPLLDLWVLRNKTTYSESTVRLLCKEAGILDYYDVCCRLLNVWFYGESHNEITNEFEKLVFSGGVFGSEATKVISQERKNLGKKRGYIFTRLFRSKREIQEFFPRSKKYPILVPFYQVVRWTHLRSPAKRKSAQSELRKRRRLTQEEIDRYDKLLKNLGF